MSERLIAIGDIHGCRVALETLLDEIQPGHDDIVVALGDYVDRGPDSRGVIDRLIELEQQTEFIPLMGNHEEMMLRVVRESEPHHAWLRYGGVETLDSYQFDGDLRFLPPAHELFFDSLRDYYESDDFFFTHACYDPALPLQLQTPEMLRWYSLAEGVPPPHPNGKTAVVGHTAQRNGEIFDAGHLMCIDTFCFGGGWLTAVDLHAREFWQASEEGRLRAS